MEVQKLSSKIEREVMFSLTADQKNLCKQMGTSGKPLPVPFLPVHGVQECKLFDTLIVQQGKGPIDFLNMTKQWCAHVDGVHVFPKLPVYLRTWYTKWLHNQRIRTAVTGTNTDTL